MSSPQRFAAAWAAAVSLRTFTRADFADRAGVGAGAASSLLARLTLAGGLGTAYAPDVAHLFSSRNTVYAVSQASHGDLRADRWRWDAARSMRIRRRFFLEAIIRSLSVEVSVEDVEAFVLELLEDGRLARYANGGRYVYAVRRDPRYGSTVLPSAPPIKALIMGPKGLQRLLDAVTLLQRYSDVFVIRSGPYPRTRCDAARGVIAYELSPSLKAFSSPTTAWLQSSPEAEQTAGLIEEVEQAEAECERLQDEWTWLTTLGRVNVPRRYGLGTDAPFPYPKTYESRTILLRRNLTLANGQVEQLRKELLDRLGQILYERRPRRWVDEFAAIRAGLFV